jgi:ribosomal protein L35
MNEKMSTNHKRHLSSSFVLSPGDAYAAAKELPYAGVR